MMGQREGGQGQFFYAFDLDKVHDVKRVLPDIDTDHRDCNIELG
jgi:hypothetical protein